MARKGIYPPSVTPGIPKLGEKPEGWIETTLDDVLEVKERRAEVDDDVEYQLVTAKRNRGGIVPRTRLFGKDIRTKTQFYTKSGDFLISKRQIVHGACGVVPSALDGALVSNEYATLRVKDGLLLEFLNHYCHTVYFQQTCFQSSVGVDVEKMIFDLKSWLKYRVYLPPLSEQRKISTVLNTWEDAISLIERLIVAKQQRRKALMQQLLTGRLRFKEFDGKPWDEVQLGEFLTIKLRKVPKPSTSYSALSLRSHGKGTFVREIEDPSTVAMNHLYRVKAGDLIVNITFAWEGAIAIAKESDEDCLVSHRFPTYVFDNRRVNPNFFKYLMVTKRFFHELELISPGGAGRNRVMSKKDFPKIKVKLPPLEEQQRCAEVLCCADTEIDLLTRELDALQRQKRGLMQRLLTGQVRVKV